MNVAGHRISTYEVESALVDHSSVAEAAVIGKTHEIKGQGISAFVTLKEGIAAERRAERRTEEARRPRKSAPSPGPTIFSSPPNCPKRAAPKSCAACCAISPKAASSATPPRSPIPQSSPSSKSSPRTKGETHIDGFTCSFHSDRNESLAVSFLSGARINVPRWTRASRRLELAVDSRATPTLTPRPHDLTCSVCFPMTQTRADVSPGGALCRPAGPASAQPARLGHRPVQPALQLLHAAGGVRLAAAAGTADI